jgi:hypothetical protein
MKFIKLFEAFESTLLSKTLNYVSGESKEKFLSAVSAICNKYDFPDSRLNDSFFQYLPYSKALNYRLEKGEKGNQVDCKAKSLEVFGDKGVEGECRAGKLPKKWGTGSRRVECPVCKGTGKTGEPDSADKLLPQNVFKFWFDETGKYVTTTYNYIKDETKVEKPDGTVKLIWCYNGSRGIDKPGFDKSGYKVVLLSEIPHLTPATLYFDRRQWQQGTGTPGYFWRYGQNTHYFIHNGGPSGGAPYGDEWRDYGRKSWSLGGGDSYVITTGNLSDIQKTKEVELKFSKSRTTGKTMFDEYGISDVKKTLADAKFAITLDIDKLVGTEFIKKSDTIKTRTGLKKDVIGGQFGIKDVDIKKQNMDRYISKLSDVSGDKLEIGNFDTYFFRILGFKNILFKIINAGRDTQYRMSKKIEDILNLNIKLVKAINKAKSKRGEYVEPKDEIDALSKSLKSYFKKEIDINNNNLKYLKVIESRCDEKHLVLLRSIEEISNVIYQKLKSFGKLESVDDAEILLEKIKTIENLIWNKRYEWSNFRINNINDIPGVPLATKSPDEIKRICNALKNVIEKV